MIESGGLYFGRTSTGMVRIVRFLNKPLSPPQSADAYLSGMSIDMYLTPEAWATIVSSVSEASSQPSKYYQALALHTSPPSRP